MITPLSENRKYYSPLRVFEFSLYQSPSVSCYANNVIIVASAAVHLIAITFTLTARNMRSRVHIVFMVGGHQG